MSERRFKVKQYAPKNFLTLLLAWVLLIALLPYSALSQCSAPRVANFDGRKHAFISKGNQGTVNWVNTGGTSIWSRCLGGTGGNITINPYPTPNPDNNTNQIYIEIRAGDNVYVPNLRLQNNLTMVICGNLTLGRLELADGDMTSLNNVNIIVCPGGSFTLDVLSAQNNVTLNIDGILTVNRIEGQASNLCIMSPDPNVTGVIRTSTGGIPYISDRWRYGTSASACTSTNPADGGIVLPVELLSFNTFVNRDGVELRWVTATEINNDYFTIERSNDLRMWEVLGFVDGSGTTSRPVSYSFIDTQPLIGIGYYRMKQTDFDGQYKYYGPVAAHFDLGLVGLEFKVIRQFSHWKIAVPDDGVYTVEVYNLQGRKLISRQTQNLLSIEAPNEPVIIRVTDGLSRTASQVFIN